MKKLHDIFSESNAAHPVGCHSLLQTVMTIWCTFLTLFYTRGSEIVVLHVMVPQPYRFSPYRYGNLTIIEFSSKWVKVMLPYREGGGLPVVGGGGSLMTHCTGSVTTQRKVFKYVMASEPYRYT
jgi:hypothetical protein